jgi:hypothetical protein
MEGKNHMHSIKQTFTKNWSKTCLSAVAALGLLASSSAQAWAGHGDDHNDNSNMRINAGTAFNFAPAFDKKIGNPIFPWSHEVRGVVQVSNLGNGTVHFNVSINSGAGCAGGHMFCLSGTMTITTLAGDELQTEVTGWADPDPNDSMKPASINLLHYDVIITGGTGKLQGARGGGEINGVFFFCGDDCFCNSYAGVATWLYEGVLQLPRGRGR